MKKTKTRLLRNASQAKTLQEICDIAYELMGNPIFVEDRSALKLAYTKNADIKDPKWYDGVVKPSLILTDRTQVEEVLLGYRMSSEQKLPVIINDSFMEGSRMIKTLFHKGEHVGTVVSPAYFKEFSEDDVDVMEILSGFIYNILTSENYPLRCGEHSLESMLFRLLRGSQFPDFMIDEIYDQMHWDKDIYHLIVDIFPRSGKKRDDIAVSEMMDAFRSIHHCQCVFIDMHIVCFIHVSKKDIYLSPDKTPFTKLLEDNNLIAGVSSPFHDLNLTERYSRQALAMAELATVLNREDIYYHYDKLACYHMMKLADSAVPLMQFCHNRILELNEYDINHNTDFTGTLLVYLEFSRSISKTAEILFIHKNTVTYRINKCFEILGTKIEDNDELFSFLFSLRILDYVRKRNPKSTQ